MRYGPGVGKGFEHSSGRVIALGRLMLATLFLAAVLIDTGQPTHAPTVTYALIAGYIAISAAIVAATWNNWWVDAQVAGPAHAVDIVMFTLLVLLTEGYTSPFLFFFMFVLLAAAIRWDWHATALTAILLILLYLVAGLFAINAGVSFDPQRFLVRTGHLVILSLILIWFGANQRLARFDLGDQDHLSGPSLDESPLEAGLRAAMKSLGSASGAFIWREQGRQAYSGLLISGDAFAEIDVQQDAIEGAIEFTPFLYDLKNDRGLRRDSDRNLVRMSPSEAIRKPAPKALGLHQGLAVPVHSDRGEGMLFLERIHGLSTDHLDVGAHFASELSAHVQRHALLRAAQESAEAR